MASLAQAVHQLVVTVGVLTAGLRQLNTTQCYAGHITFSVVWLGNVMVSVSD